MSDDKKPFQSTPTATLEQHVMDARIAKSEAEWWANREIERLRARVAVMEKALRQIQTRPHPSVAAQCAGCYGHQQTATYALEDAAP
jgi:hypothetical protein